MSQHTRRAKYTEQLQKTEPRIFEIQTKGEPGSQKKIRRREETRLTVAEENPPSLHTQQHGYTGIEKFS